MATKHLDKKQKALYGTKIENIETIVLTPIDKIFYLFKDRFIEEYKGWWKSALINEKTLLVKCPVGTHSADAVYYSPTYERLCFLGFCGSCSKEIPVGTIVEAKSAQRGNDFIESTWSLSECPRVKVFQVESLHEQEDEKFTRIMNKNSMDCVDMETYSIFYQARLKSGKYGAIYFVTDNLLNCRFYESSNQKFCRKIRGVLEDII